MGKLTGYPQNAPLGQWQPSKSAHDPNPPMILGGEFVTVDVASFALAGIDAGMVHGYILVADVANFALTGNPAIIGTRVGRVMFAELAFPQAPVRTGRVMFAELAFPQGPLNYPMSAVVGAFALTGSGATFPRTVVMPAVAVAFTVTGSDATLTRTLSYTLTADPAAFTVTGSDATLVFFGINHYTLPALVGTFSVLGIAAGLVPLFISTTGAGGGKIVYLPPWPINFKPEPSTYSFTGSGGVVVGGYVTVAYTPVSVYRIMAAGGIAIGERAIWNLTRPPLALANVEIERLRKQVVELETTAKRMHRRRIDQSDIELLAA